MAAIVPAVRREPDEADVRVGFAPSSVDTWMQLADLANWLRGSGAQIVAGTFTNTDVTTGNTRVWHFRAKPRMPALQRVWVFFLRTTSGAVVTTATVKAPASSGTSVVYTVDRMRVRAFPFPDSVKAFIEQHEQVFVVERNRDAQLRAMLVNELQIDPARLVPILHYDGTPITARYIVKAIKDRMPGANVRPLKGGKAA